MDEDRISTIPKSYFRHLLTPPESRARTMANVVRALALLEALPSFLRPPVLFACRTGRRKRELLNLTWDKVDLKERTASLLPSDTKNKEARSIYLNDELLKLLKSQKLRRVKDCPYVFHRNSEPIKDLRGSWKNTCAKAGLSGKLFHDFRRTAVRNLVRSGVPETVAMMITGHKTRSVFDRYNIVSSKDLKMAAERQSELSRMTVTKQLQSPKMASRGKLMIPHK